MAKFQALKDAFRDAPVRGYPCYDGAPFILDTDFSAAAMAAVLSQEQDGQEVIIGVAAKKVQHRAGQLPFMEGRNGRPGPRVDQV